MSAQPPTLATWLLLQSGAPEALVGDLQEAFAANPSRAWYWYQVLMAVFVSFRCIAVRHRLRALRAVGGAAVVYALISAVACGPQVDVYRAVEVDVLTSGWAEVESTSGQTKLVPAISFRLKNRSDESLPVLQVNAIFRRGDEHAEWGNAFRTAVGSSGLAPGRTTRELMVVSQRGYTGTETAAELLVNSHFVDARVDLFGRYGSRPWARLGEYMIARTLVAP